MPLASVKADLVPQPLEILLQRNTSQRQFHDQIDPCVLRWRPNVGREFDLKRAKTSHSWCLKTSHPERRRVGR